MACAIFQLELVRNFDFDSIFNIFKRCYLCLGVTFIECDWKTCVYCCENNTEIFYWNYFHFSNCVTSALTLLLYRFQLWLVLQFSSSTVSLANWAAKAMWKCPIVYTNPIGVESMLICRSILFSWLPIHNVQFTTLVSVLLIWTWNLILRCYALLLAFTWCAEQWLPTRLIETRYLKTHRGTLK